MSVVMSIYPCHRMCVGMYGHWAVLQTINDIYLMKHTKIQF